MPTAERVTAFRSEMQLEQYTKVIGSIGRLNWQKGYDLLIGRAEALDRKIPAGERWLVLILGDGPERAGLQSMIDRLQLKNMDIRLGGFFPDAASLMSQFDVFVMPSRYEGYGLALAEAMTLGLPVVSADIDSLPELCAMYQGAYRLVDMDRDETGEALADAVFQMAAASSVSGQILQSHGAMAEEYLELYRSASEKYRKKT